MLLKSKDILNEIAINKKNICFQQTDKVKQIQL